ncbi:sulfite oxidase-like oxidoreductase [Zavarzinia aquatilis]|uniref:Sulfite oxidase-like oxidoreductase n=1 Tax=Zavarzinia aquatilis TaxID=2211142 RepID=A0A317E5F1_9PROT|nr:sulfite oxidase-like oxidoreductase [Zavarzinia aquatilis]PWR20235.1 sulfite oxidase-like oxidoreductase [Zavarzinia aquatilis]
MTDDDKPGLIGAIKEKLIATKEKWAKDGRLLTGQAAERSERLPPGQRLVKDWPVLDLGVQPSVPTDVWRLDVDGAVVNPLSWGWQEFMAQPQVDDVSDIHCVTAWSRYDNRWTGVSAQYLLALVQPRPEARHVVLHAYDGYTTNVTLENFAAPDVVIAHGWEGRPLSREHGGPVRLIVPQYYFWKSAKWLKRIEFRADDKPGFWEVRGYHNEGDPWKEDRYS